MKLTNICAISRTGISGLSTRPCLKKYCWITNPNRFYSSTSPRKESAKQMQQVEVDDAKVKQKLGDIQMAFVKKAELRNKDRASTHVFYRRKDWLIGITCMTIAISIYAYTIFAMKQETFLDDFEMPDPLQEEERQEK